MGLLLVSLAALDLILVLLVTIVAFLGRRPSRLEESTERTFHTLQRSRLQFAVLAAAWCLVLAGHLLVLLFEVVAETAQLYLFLGQGALLALALLFAVSLYGAPAKGDPAPAPEDAAR